jgi:thiol-disulfide isomerase/thioredoxin
LAP